MAVVLTLAQTKQIRINIHKLNNTKNTVQTIQNKFYILLIVHLELYLYQHSTLILSFILRFFFAHVTDLYIAHH
jgi:hypothetical protein